jgi:uncharacterized surface protein with fasciclin (FAS1) repeats
VIVVMHIFLDWVVFAWCQQSIGITIMTFSKIGLRLAATVVAALFAMTPVRAANIVETADKAGQFKTLLAAATAAGLAGDLAQGSPLTVFAPTDAAFRRLPKGTVENLLKPENRDQLRSILMYHVLPARVAAKDVSRQPTRVATLNGTSQVLVVRNGNGVHVDNARVVKADIVADNGIIHVINRVLIPKQH